MKKRISLAFLLILTIAASPGLARSVSHSASCLIFLSGDEGKDKPVMAEAGKARATLGHRMHLVVFTAEVRRESVVRTLAGEFKLKRYPAVLIDGKPLTKGKPIVQACREAARRTAVTISPHLATDLIDGNYVTLYYACCYEPGESLEGGRMMVFVVADGKSPSGQLISNTCRKFLADSRSYDIPSGSCHKPERSYWPLPKGTDVKQLAAVGILWDAEMNVISTFCSAACPEASK